MYDGINLVNNCDFKNFKSEICKTLEISCRKIVAQLLPVNVTQILKMSKKFDKFCKILTVLKCYVNNSIWIN